MAIRNITPNHIPRTNTTPSALLSLSSLALAIPSPIYRGLAIRAVCPTKQDDGARDREGKDEDEVEEEERKRPYPVRPPFLPLCEFKAGSPLPHTAFPTP